MVISNVSKRLCNFSKHTQTRCPKCFPESVYRYSYHHFSKGDKLDYHFMRYDGLIMVLGGDVELVINNENFTLSDGDMFVIPMLSVVSFTALTAVDIYSHTFKVERYHDCMSRKLEGYIHLHGYNSIPSVPVKLTPSLLSYIETLKFQIEICQIAFIYIRIKVMNSGRCWHIVMTPNRWPIYFIPYFVST